MTSRLDRIWQAMAARPLLASALLGAISACGFPPLRLWPVGLAALALFITLLRKANCWKHATLMGWLFGLAHLTVANNWIATAFTYQAEMPQFLGWLAVPLLCLYLAVYPALAAITANRLGRNAGTFTFSAIFAAAWIITEWLRSWVFTGYPWPPLGLMLLGDFDSPGIPLLLPWLGTYALSGLAILIAAGFAALVQQGRRIGQLVLALLVIGAMTFPFGSLTQAEGSIRYALVQPLIPQAEREDPGKFEDQFIRIAQLTMPGSDSERLVLWPEAAIPDYLENGYPQRYYSARTTGADPDFARQRIGVLIGQQSMLLTGLVHLDIGQLEGRTTAVSARNSVSAIDGRGEIVGDYAKAHLVPYGEYLPMREILEPIGLSRLVAGSIDYLPGPGPRTFNLGRFGMAGIQICYEIVFSGQVVDRSNRPDYIFNPSNDGWFGSWGPPQHVAQARLRAIEEGLPVLRSTTTGISAVIDANGVVRQHVPTGVTGRLDGLIPPAKAPTLFARLGNWLPLGWALLILAASLVAMRRRRV
ncbi:apolipoprotein N-acyltransferase [Altererythrobacter litoralis]|uniref:Apolipoprotein N-acyltransferase n=1 Tax=Altererythrobacter litoralis TaxID=3113904 RepID=A0ABU7GCB5_9SPHN|nr:apolipoprotein N-acyltransferase [Erythrobacteraceae bacterium 1XM1-14]